MIFSTEIAALTGKRHDHVIRDIEIILKQLNDDSQDLGSGFKSSTYKGSNGQEYKCYELDYEATMIVMTGYDVVENANPVAVSVFNFESHNVRTINDDNGDVWFLAKDVCDILGYKNTSSAVSNHCKKEKGIEKFYTLTTGGEQKLIYVSESNLFRLICGSTLPAALQFESWVFEEVLPAIRKTGKYEAPKVEPKPLVPIAFYLKNLGSEEVNSVSARELYLDLGMDKSNWAKWSKSNIEENTFFENGLDWVGFVLSTNGNDPPDFAVTIEFAKHIAMMAKTQRAHDYRNRLIGAARSRLKNQDLKFEFVPLAEQSQE